MSEVYAGKNVGFAFHIFGRELCRNRSETAFFGAQFRLRTFLILRGKKMEKIFAVRKLNLKAN